MNGNLTCSLCKTEPAGLFCVCSNLPAFCLSCRGLHETKPGFHFALSMAGRGYVTLQNQSQYMAWLLCLTNSQAKLRGNIQRIQKCEEEIEALYYLIQAEIDKTKIQLLQTLEELKAALSVKIEESIRETTAYAYAGDYHPSSPLASLLWTHSSQQSSEPIVVFTYHVNSDIESLQGLMDVSFQSTLPELSQFRYENGRANLHQEIDDFRMEVVESNPKGVNLDAEGHNIGEALPPTRYTNNCAECKAQWTSHKSALLCDNCKKTMKPKTPKIEENKAISAKGKMSPKSIGLDPLAFASSKRRLEASPVRVVGKKRAEKEQLKGELAEETAGLRGKLRKVEAENLAKETEIQDLKGEIEILERKICAFIAENEPLKAQFEGEKALFQTQIWELEDQIKVKEAEILGLKINIEETENCWKNYTELLQSHMAEEAAASCAVVLELRTEIEALKRMAKPDSIVPPEVAYNPRPAPPLIEPQVPSNSIFAPATSPPKSVVSKPEAPLMGNPESAPPAGLSLPVPQSASPKPAVSSVSKSRLPASPPVPPKLEEQKIRSAMRPESGSEPAVPPKRKVELPLASPNVDFTLIKCHRCKHSFQVPTISKNFAEFKYCANCKEKGKDCALF